MQQGIQFHLNIQVVGAALTDVETIEFLFKQSNLDTAEALKTALWKSDGSGNAQTAVGEENVVSIPWTREETYLFKRSSPFYLHARIHYTGVYDEPEIPIIPLIMAPSLFSINEGVV